MIARVIVVVGLLFVAALAPLPYALAVPVLTGGVVILRQLRREEEEEE